MTSPTMWPPQAPQGHPAGAAPYPYPALPGYPHPAVPPNQLPPDHGGWGPSGPRKPRRGGRKLMAAIFAASAVVTGVGHFALTHSDHPALAVTAEPAAPSEPAPYSMDGKPTGYVSHPSQPLPLSEVGTGTYGVPIVTGEGTFPVDNLTDTVKAGTQFTTKGGGVYGSSPVCVMGPMTRVIPTAENPEPAFTEQFNLRWTTTAGNCAAIPGADVFINVRGNLVKVGGVDGGITSDGTSDIRLDAGVKIDPSLTLTGITYPETVPDAVAFETVYPGGKAVIITGPRPEDQVPAVVLKIKQPEIGGGDYRIFIGSTGRALTQKDRGSTVMAVGGEVKRPLVMGTVMDTRDPANIEVTPFDDKITPITSNVDLLK